MRHALIDLHTNCSLDERNETKNRPLLEKTDFALSYHSRFPLWFITCLTSGILPEELPGILSLVEKLLEELSGILSLVEKRIPLVSK
jgi:hypothetical protein